MNLKRRQELYRIRAERARQRRESSPHYNQPLDYFLALDWPKVAPLAWRSAQQARGGSDADVVRHLAGINYAANLPQRALAPSDAQELERMGRDALSAFAWDRRKFARHMYRAGIEKQSIELSWRGFRDWADGVMQPC